MSDNIINSATRRLFYSLGTMLIIISILIAAILLFVSFGKGASWERGFTGVILAIMSFILIWLSSINRKSITTTWYGILAGMMTWMVLGEISHQFGFAKIEAELGFILLIYLTVITSILWKRNLLPWGIKVYSTCFLLNWWGHSILLNQHFLEEALNNSIFSTTYKITGGLCLIGFAWLIWRIIRKPATRSELIYYGLWLYALLVTGIEGITDITSNTFGH
ncbi:MAG: hypothetical protein AB7V16_07580 [Vulcanibacillus sp.]